MSKQNTQIFLDYNATAPLRVGAKEAMMQALGLPYNPASAHSFGRAGRSIVEKSREIIAGVVGVPASQVIFGSGATEANNTVLKHFTNTYPDEAILVGATEHPSVRIVIKDAEKMPVDGDGLLNLAALEQRLVRGGVSLVSIMLVNNETGVIQPIREISALVHKHGALLHCDATQAAGKLKLSMGELGIDFMSLSSHKVGGAQGVGALVLGMCGITPILLEGGSQEKYARAGTLNVAGIASFGAAMKEAYADFDGENARISALNSKLEAALRQIDPRTIIFAENAPRAHNTTAFALKGLNSEVLMMRLDLDGFAISRGSACSSGASKPSVALMAMGFDEDTANAALRLSIGWATTESDIEKFIKAWAKIHTQMAEKIKDAA